ncbi:hypothetical protein ColKHC_14080 [Colletotrichum higginsianum]|nr:hypothetical protein ColKHC_14080 [Colletotrichum higginsianum]
MTGISQCDTVSFLYRSMTVMKGCRPRWTGSNWPEAEAVLSRAIESREKLRKAKTLESPTISQGARPNGHKSKLTKLEG